ncbi:MAG TPA: gephyrin-like molybdotransferase Glp [Bryobacteraceae bacterium]|nr:gephyrin-like molybdotransferase Glp [Bryobacteraceae bacterium]
MREAPAPPALPFEEARQIVVDTVRALPHPRTTETVPLDAAYGRRLAEALRADRDYPALRRSLRDGFAVHASDLPGTLRVRGELRAGEHAAITLGPGEAIEIMTGAPLPEGADAVVMVEHVTRVNGDVKIDRTAEPGQFINGRGAEARAGTELIAQGTRLDASHIATLAGAGRSSVPVFTRPRVAILATGDEIVALDEEPQPHQIRNSNSHMLAALVRRAGGEPSILPIARDTRAALDPLLVQGLASDMLVISGGVSAGKYDLVKPALCELGALFYFERVRIQPGQPAVFGTRAAKPVFGLPGNPGSSLVTFELFARPALELLAGESEPILPLLSARFEAPFRHKLGLTRFLPARLSADGQHLRHIPWQGSSDIPALARANCFLVADHDRESWNTGDSIRVLSKP